MKNELTNQIAEVEDFFKNSTEGQKLDAIEEMLYNLIQSIDIRERAVVKAEILKRLTELTQNSHDGYDPFSLDYFAQTNAFINGYMKLFSEKLHSANDIESILTETTEVLQSHLPIDRKHQIASSLLKEFIAKVKMIGEDENLKANPTIQEMVQFFVVSDNCIDEFLKIGASGTISMLLGVISAIYAIEHDDSYIFT
jgi:hypothetical protein